MYKRSLLSTSVAAAMALASQPLLAQDAPSSNDQILEEVVVTGIRSSLNQAIDIKRDSMSVVDSIVAEDIGKLPDNNVVESLQRVSGVQVTDRGSGEVSGVSIRGLTDVSTTVNGRTIFTASGRSVALADIPSTLVSRIDVIKSRSASDYENGIAGQIDVQTFRPFDFDGSRVSISGRAIHMEEAEETDPVVSGLISDRWDTSAGEFGALLNVSYARTNYRDQSVTPGAQIPFMTENPADGGWMPLQRIRTNDEHPALADAGITVEENPIWEPGQDNGMDTAPGSTIPINGEDTEYYLSRDAMFMSDVTGERERPAANIALQFAPNDRSEYTFETFYNGYRNESFNSLHFAFLDNHFGLEEQEGGVTGSFELHDDSNVIRERTVQDPFTFGSGDFTKEETDSYVYALGGEWDLTDNFTLNSELVYQESEFESSFIALRNNLVRNEVTTNFSNDPSISFGDDPTTDVDESDLTELTQFDMGEMFNTQERNEGSSVTFTADGEYFAEGDFFTQVNFGVRYDDRDTTEYFRDQNTGVDGCSVRNTTGDPENCQFSSYIGEGISSTNSDFLDGVADVPRSWSVVDGSYLTENRTEFLELYGLDPNDPLLEEFSIAEENIALYLTAQFDTEVAGKRVDGEIGGRYVDVQTDSVFTDQVEQAQTDGSISTSEFLPSLAVRYHLNEDLLLRLTYGETLRMPDFGDLNPTVTYSDDITSIGYGTAEAGNADLEKTTSQNLDLSLEWYFGDASSAYVTLFQRDIEGLVVPTREVVERDIEGFTADQFILSRPENASEGKLTGAELGLTYFPENLPGYWDGLGVQASFTALDSDQKLPQYDNETGELEGNVETPMFGVSDTSYTVSLAYERDTFDARLAYTWRDDFLYENEAAQFANPLGVYRDPQQSLDFQFSYNVTDEMVVTFDATNLTEEVYQSRYGNSDLHTFGNWQISRTFALGARYSF